MSTPSPLQPQGSLQNQGKSNLKITVFTILAIHVVVLGGLLMQGCSHNDKAKETVMVKTNDLPPLPPIENTPPPVFANANTNPVTPIMTVVEPLKPVTPIVVESGPSSTKDYLIAKGDTLGKIAHDNHVSVAAIEKANPGINAKSLQIKQKIVIPASSAPAVAATKAEASAGGSTDVSGSAKYEVKAGDNLVKIAKSHGTTVKAIQLANSLKTTQIRTGQKLKIPAKLPGVSEATKEASAASTGNTSAALPETTKQ